MTIYPAQVHGSRLLVLLVRTNAKYREEFAWVCGKATYDAGSLVVDRGGQWPPLVVPPFALDGLRPADESMQRAFAPADYLVSVRLEGPDKDANYQQLDTVGLNWEA